MSGKLRIVVADDNSEFCQQFSAAVSKEAGLDLLSIVNDGAAAVSAVTRLHPDVLLLDMILPKLDGLAVLDALHALHPKPRILVLSAFGQESLVARTLELGADYYIMKPFDMSTLMFRLRQLAQPQIVPITFRIQQQRQNMEKELEKEVIKQMSMLGVPSHYKGFIYLREAIVMAVENSAIMDRMTKGLYPAIAAKCNTSPHQVERAIRHAVEATWTKGNLKMIDELFAYSVDVEKGKPTNSSFIARLADQVRMKVRTR
jgi:two-component system response regulator (stage 0 sporulation protein A)